MTTSVPNKRDVPGRRARDVFMQRGGGEGWRRGGGTRLVLLHHWCG